MTRAASPEEIAQALGNSQPIAGGYKCRCPGHDDKRASLQINVRGKDGRPSIFCHSCGQGSEGRIYRLIEEQTGLHFEGRELPSTRRGKKEKLLVPAPTPFPRNKTLPSYGAADIIYEYRNENDKLCFVVGRWDTASGKEMRPAVCVEINGESRWTWKLAGYVDKVLYNQHKLPKRPDATVLVVEGEKAADAAEQVFPDYVVVTYQGGAKAWNKSSWELLKGRDIILWPDNDDPGREAFHDLGMYLNVEGFAKSVKIAYVPKSWPKGWDLADEMPGSLNEVLFKEAPQGGQEFYLQNTDHSNYMETFDSLYVLYYDGAKRYTLSRQQWMAYRGRPFGLKNGHLINTNHPAWRSVMTREGPGIQLWADAKLREDDYVDGEVFDPNSGMIVEEHGGKKLNSFTGFMYKPDISGSCEGFKQYILHVLADGDKKGYEYIFNYLSHMIQHPHDRPTIAMVFKGKQGAGKSFVGRIMSDLLGGPYGYAFRSQTIDGVAAKFNHQLASKLLVWIEELELTKSRSMENRLKSLITDPVIAIERKGHDVYNQTNLGRVMGSTNHEHIWNVNASERRLTLFEVSESRLQDREYFKGLHEEMKNGGYNRLMYELLNWDVDFGLVNQPFINRARKTQELLTPEPARDLAYRLLTEGSIILRVLNERREQEYFQRINSEDWSKSSQRLSSKVLRAVLREMAGSSKYNESYSARDKRISAKTVVEYLGGDGSYTTVNVFVQGDTIRDAGYKIPPLEEARQHFANLAGMNFEDLFPFHEQESAQIIPLKQDQDIPF